MSKMDNLRAMREARYEAARAATTRTTAKTTRQAAPAAKPTKAEVVPEPEQEGLCGHRNISGRTCTRDKGHSAKTHRYS